MQVPRVEDMVREEREPKRPHPQVSEDSLAEFLENESNLSTVSDLNVRYR
jgi:hypothetical protein